MLGKADLIEKKPHGITIIWQSYCKKLIKGKPKSDSITVKKSN